MKWLIKKFYNEPVFFLGTMTVALASASAIWNNQWLMFATAVFAGVSTIVARHNVAPINN